MQFTFSAGDSACAVTTNRDGQNTGRHTHGKITKWRKGGLAAQNMVYVVANNISTGVSDAFYIYMTCPLIKVSSWCACGLKGPKPQMGHH